jgi:hypothetical protein
MPHRMQPGRQRYARRAAQWRRSGEGREKDAPPLGLAAESVVQCGHCSPGSRREITSCLLEQRLGSGSGRSRRAIPAELYRLAGSFRSYVELLNFHSRLGVITENFVTATVVAIFVVCKLVMSVFI